MKIYIPLFDFHFHLKSVRNLLEYFGNKLELEFIILKTFQFASIHS